MKRLKFNMNVEIITEKITNADYFYMIDNQVRPAMIKIETEEFLPLAKSFLEKCNITLDELEDFPIEGYYYETEELSLYFKILRNLQHNIYVINKLIECDELEQLKQITNNDLFGLEDPSKRGGAGPIKRRYDILTRTLERMPTDMTNPWSINTIMDAISNEYGNRTNLVELAYLTKNPKCLCCGAETNCLYRMFAHGTGSCCSSSYRKIEYVWQVSPEVEELGQRIVIEYNKLINKNVIEIPTISNVNKLNREPKVPRVALLGYVATSKEYYHWILDHNGKLHDIYSKYIITTQTYDDGVRKTKWVNTIPSDNNWQLYSTSYTGNIFNATSPDITCSLVK